MKTIQLSFIVAVSIIVTVVGLSTARTVEAAAAPVNQGVPSLQNAVNTLQDTVNSLRIVVDGIRGDLALVKRELSGLELACTTPDLVPLPVGSAGFSRCDDKGNLHVTVQNQGGGNAAASVTQVFFRVAGSTQCGTDCAQVDAATSPLAAFSGIDLAIKIPNGRFDINNICKFKISVDGNNDVKNESNEANNNAAGECSGTIL